MPTFQILEHWLSVERLLCSNSKNSPFTWGGCWVVIVTMIHTVWCSHAIFNKAAHYGLLQCITSRLHNFREQMLVMQIFKQYLRIITLTLYVLKSRFDVAWCFVLLYIDQEVVCEKIIFIKHFYWLCICRLFFVSMTVTVSLKAV